MIAVQHDHGWQHGRAAATAGVPRRPARAARSAGGCARECGARAGWPPGAGEALEPGIAQRQRITAAQDDLLDRGVARDLVQRLAPAWRLPDLLRIREFAPEAVTAVHGAGRVVMSSARPRYFCSRPRARRARRSPSGSSTKSAARQLGGRRQHLPQQRVVGVAAAHPATKLRGTRRRKCRPAALRAQEAPGSRSSAAAAPPGR